MKKSILFILPFFLGFTGDPCDAIFIKLKKSRKTDPMFVHVTFADFKTCDLVNFEQLMTFPKGLAATNYHEISDNKAYIVLNGSRNDTLFECVIANDNKIKKFYSFPCQRKTQ